MPELIPGIDQTQALERLGGDWSLLLTLLRKFRELHADSVAEVRGLIEAGDLIGAARVLHTLRGVAGNLGALEIQELASTGEAALKQGRAEAVPAILAPLEKALGAICEAIAGLSPELAPESTPEPAKDTRAPAPAPDSGFEPVLTPLLDLVRTNNLRAMEEFAARRGEITAGMGEEAVQTLADALDLLDFAAAERYLAAMIGSTRRLDKT